MNRGSADTFLSALFIDYDNIYLSLKRRNEAAAGRFARDPYLWLSEIVSGKLIRYGASRPNLRRRIALGRCYGNPVPRRTSREGPNDPQSFSFVRHHFMRAGLEVIDCPPLTAQLKNGSDIRMAIDIRDYLEHASRFEEFIILSGDADFTPVLHRLRCHDRRAVIYANDHTAAPYAALCDGRVEEADLVEFLLQGGLPASHGMTPGPASGKEPQPFAENTPGKNALSLHDAKLHDAKKRRPALPNDPAVQALIDDFKLIAREILQLVLEVVESSEKPVPIAYLADRAQKTLGHPKTVGTNWAGCGGFLTFLSQNLPQSLRISEKPPHFVFDPERHGFPEEKPEAPAAAAIEPAVLQPVQQTNSGRLAALQKSITRIYDACQAPPLPPSEYHLLFTLIAAEVKEYGFAPDRTATAVVARAGQAGLKIALQDVGFVLEAVDEIDPWLEHSRSPAAVGRAYRDYVLARCHNAGLSLTEDEFQLVQVWFGASQWTSDQPSWTSDQPNEANRLASPEGEALLARTPLGKNMEAVLGGRGQLPREASLPSPSSLGDIPLPPDFLSGKEQERQPRHEDTAKSSGMRFGFLKHG